jgi:phosphoesterase RecJ-like protein
MRAMLNEMTFRADDRIGQLESDPRDHGLGVRCNRAIPRGLIDTLRMVDTVVAAVIFEDMPDGKIRASARSKDARVECLCRLRKIWRRWPSCLRQVRE